MTTKEPPPRLKETAVKKALKTLDWDEFEQHLSAIDFDQTDLTEFLGHIRRSSDFLIKRPDEAREAARFAFLEELGKFLEDHLGQVAAAQLGEELTVIQRIEAGYREILHTQGATVAAKLPPDTQAAAALYRAAYSYQTPTEETRSSILKRKELTLQSLRVERPDGSSYSPDGMFTRIVNIATMTLLLLGHRFNWFDAQTFLVLPNLPDVTEDEVFKAGLTEVLAASWRDWQQVEQRCRYFGGDLKVFTGAERLARSPRSIAEFLSIPTMDIGFSFPICIDILVERGAVE
jgi:hypothetical protein